MPESRTPLQSEVAAAFVGAARRIIDARPVFRDGLDRKRVSQRALTGAKRLSRSAIAKILSSEKAANPTLNSICQIAQGLGVPPAFLLMRDGDWKLLAQAIDEYEKNSAKDAVAKLKDELASDPDHSPSNSVEHGRRIAETILGIKRPPSPEWVIQADYEKQMNRIGAACAAPPLESIHSTHSRLVPLLLTICARMGSAFRSK